MRRWYLTAALLVVALASSALDYVRNVIRRELGLKPIAVQEAVTAVEEGGVHATLTYGPRVLIVLDVSASMADPGVWHEATADINAALAGLSDDTRVGVVTFDDEGHYTLPYVRLEVARTHIARLLEGTVPGGGSNLSDGIRVAFRAARSQRPLARFDATRPLQGADQLWLVSDGEPNLGALDPTRFGQLGDQAQDLGLRVRLLGDDEPGYLAEIFKIESER